jgi:hypothetical protein
LKTYYLGLGLVVAGVVVWTLIDGKIDLRGGNFAVERKSRPVLYWTLTGALAVLAAWLIVGAAVPYLLSSRLGDYVRFGA